MAEEIKICKIIIKGYDQFKDIELDFTDPKTGEPLEKICFIGRNGTGKSKLLKVIDSLLKTVPIERLNGSFAVKIKVGENLFFWVNGVPRNMSSIGIPNFWTYYKEGIERQKGWLEGISIRPASYFSEYGVQSNSNNDGLAEAISYFGQKGN